MKQRSDEWFKARAAMVTGSMAGAILGCDPHTSRKALLKRKVLEFNGMRDDFSNCATEYGRFHEQMALQDCLMDYPDIHFEEQGFVVSKSIPWLGASPDGILIMPTGERVNFEIKCPYGKKDDKEPEFLSIEELPHYKAQCHVEMWCTGTKRTWFMQWNNHKYDIQIIKFDVNYWLDILGKLAEFYGEFEGVKDDPYRFMRNEMMSYESIALVNEYFELKESIKVQQDRQKAIIDDLVERAGGNDTEIAGHKLTKVERKGTVAYAKVVKDHLPDIDLAEYTGKSTEYWRLS